MDKYQVDIIVDGDLEIVDTFETFEEALDELRFVIVGEFRARSYAPGDYPNTYVRMVDLTTDEIVDSLTITRE